MPESPNPSASLGAAIGTTALSVGLLLLAFAGYQLWGTAMTEAKAQDELAQSLAATLPRTAPPSPDRTGSSWPADEPGLGLSEPADAALVMGHAEAQPSVRDDGGRAAGNSAVTPISTAEVQPDATPETFEIGQPMARLQIPTIGVDKTVVEGTTREALRTGPGHYLGTARPGQRGNVAIAGHRTTYGAPFHDIDELEPGDPIVVETADGVFTYRVEAQTLADGGTSGHQIVAPEDVHVIADQGDHRLTLTACHPLYSARQRIVVTAVLDQPAPAELASAPGADAGDGPGPGDGAGAGAGGNGSDAETGAGGETTATPGFQADTPSPPSTDRTVSVPVPLPTVSDRGFGAPDPAALAAGPTAIPAGLEDDLGWQTQHAGATAGWATLTALVAAGAWFLGRLWRRAPAYLMAVPSFTLCLLTCFGHLDRLIPAA